MQGVKQTLKTLNTLNDLKFDLVTPGALNSTKFEQSDLRNPEKYTQEIPIK